MSDDIENIQPETTEATEAEAAPKTETESSQSLDTELVHLERKAAEIDGKLEVLKDPNYTPPVNLEWDKVLSPILGATFSILAPNWQIQPEETSQLANAYGSVIDAYFPDAEVDPKIGALLAAATVTGAVFMPRMDVPRKLEDKGQPQKKQSQQTSENGMLPVFEGEESDELIELGDVIK